MKKVLKAFRNSYLAALLVLITIPVSAQLNQVNGVGEKRGAYRAIKALYIPYDNMLYSINNEPDSGRITYFQKRLWLRNDTGWVKVGADLDTTSLSARIDQKLNTSDTLDMLSSYLRKVDTTGKWKPLLWFPGVSEVTGLQDSLSDRYTKDQSDARYLQGNQTITLSGDVLGSGTTGISTALKNTGTAGTYTKVTTDAQGRVTSGTTLSAGDIPNLSSTYIPLTQKGAANGVASLGSDGKVPSSQLPTTGSLYQGTWNASTNTPTIADGVGTAGWYYRVSTGGTQDLGSGDITFNAGDDVIYNGTIWQRVPAASAVSSVNGMTGDVVIDKDDVGLGNVDNTSDLAKPVSTATQTALNGKEPTIAPGTTAQYWRGDKTWQTLSTAVRPLFSAGTGLTYNSTTGAFAANFGTTAGTVMQGNDSRVTGAVPNTRTITAGTGLTGGGDLTVNRSFAIDPAYASFTNYYTKTNLQTSGQAAVHWGNVTNAPTFWQASNHPAGSAFTMTYTGAEVPATATYNSAGHTTAQTKRNLTAGDIDAAPESGSGNYIQNRISTPQTGNSWVTGVHRASTSVGVWRDGSASIDQGIEIRNAAGTRGMIEQLNNDATPGMARYIHNGSTWVKRQEYFANGTALFYGKTLMPGSSGLIGNNTGAANSPVFSFYESDGTTRQGYVGLASASNEDMYLQSDNGGININTLAADKNINLNATGIVALNNATKNHLQFAAAGISAPTFTTRSVGTKVVLYPTLSASAVDYGIGIESSHQWFSAPQNTTQYGFKWYGGTTEVARLSGTGQLSVNTSLTSPLLTAPSGSNLSISAPASHSLFFNPGGTNRGVWDGDGRLGIGTTPNSLRASLLEVNGNVWSTDAYLLGTGSTPISEYYMAGSNAGIRTMNGTANLTFDVNQTTEVMRITPTARVGIGTASPAATLHVNGSISNKTRLITTASPFSVTDTDHIIIMEGGTIGTGGGDGVLITLPNPATNEGRELIFWEGTTSAWATNYSILRTANAPLDIIQNAMIIRVIGGQWRLISQSN